MLPRQPKALNQSRQEFKQCVVSAKDCHIKEDSCWLGTKCDTCGGVHPTERHDFATRFSPKAEEKGPGKKVHIAPLYSKDKK